jgi:hypothetical protein
MRELLRTRAPDTKLVQACAGDVESLQERGVTWVSFKPISDLPCSCGGEYQEWQCNLGLPVQLN